MSFSRYPEYKESRLEWLPRIPAHWVDRKIARDISFVVGWTPPSGKEEYYDGDLPWVTIADMTQMTLDDTKSKISHLAVQEKGARIVPAESMLFSFKLSVGKVSFLSIDSYTNEAIASFLPSRLIDLGFWKYAAPEFIPRYGRENIYGATLLNQELIGSVRFFAPEKIEQTKIARFLDHETAKIDALIEQQQRLIELLKEKRQAVISHAVTKGLDPTVPMKDSGVEWLGEVPVLWETMLSKYLFDTVTSGSRGWAEFYADEGDLFFRITNLTRDSIAPKLESIQHVVPPKNSEGERSRIMLDDILISITADLGSVCVANSLIESGYVSQHVALARPVRGKFSSRWIGYLVLSTSSKEQLVGAGYGGTKVQLSLDDIRTFFFALPPLSEQTEIAEYLDGEVKQFDSLIDEANKGIGFLTERRSALISAAVTGKIDVRNWQPSVSDTQQEKQQELAHG